MTYSSRPRLQILSIGQFSNTCQTFLHLSKFYTIQIFYDLSIFLTFVHFLHFFELFYILQYFWHFSNMSRLMSHTKRRKKIDTPLDIFFLTLKLKFTKGTLTDKNTKGQNLSFVHQAPSIIPHCLQMDFQTILKACVKFLQILFRVFSLQKTVGHE